LSFWLNSREDTDYISPRHDAEAIILDSNAQDQTLGLQFLQAILTCPLCESGAIA
jgi:hypothetical protein